MNTINNKQGITTSNQFKRDDNGVVIYADQIAWGEEVELGGTPISADGSLVM